MPDRPRDPAERLPAADGSPGCRRCPSGIPADPASPPHTSVAQDGVAVPVDSALTRSVCGGCKAVLCMGGCPAEELVMGAASCSVAPDVVPACIEVHLIRRREQEILLGRRINTGDADGKLSTALRLLGGWAHRNRLTPSEASYVAWNLDPGSPPAAFHQDR